MQALDVRALARQGRVQAGARCVWLAYTEQGQSKRYRVDLDWTACAKGGQRCWWLCPACGRRVAVLYGGEVFACRECHGLAYASQKESAAQRAVRRAGHTRRRLGWTGGIANLPGGKPKGMHWRTFERLQADYAVQALRALRGMVESLQGIERRAGKVVSDWR